ncbi:beta-lactamase family protein [Asticcacaulis biprosthecium C19]|uniref:Beta-lactamase family protein n=1 Tax=Asticcacaulis biprosthecium C19 TaxID=715226 RepID=F4QKI3_9CAUL|nr:serine hydrolase domain-containing protein [Asticcacaulis biprosthecium]EGF92135.1 beta-lactamase family protein [Asticcacaulis biprosthecium C19]
MVDISGVCPEPFSRVKDAFAALFESGQERGARFTAVIAGQTVVDLYAGSADRDGAQPFNANTLTPIFSTGKAVMALMIARLVDKGKLDYDAAVSHYWPEFGQAGKSRITVGQLMSHQHGLPGFSPAQPDPAIWFDPQATIDALCKQTPMWTPGTASGYTPIAGGYLIGELFRRIDGRTLGSALREDIATRFGLDLFIGTPDSEVPRIAALQKPPAAPDLGTIDKIKQAAFLDRGSAPAGRGSDVWRRAEIPSANMHASALGLAKLLNAVANGGLLDGKAIISPKGIELATRERIIGQDKVLPFKLSWGAGFLRNKGIGIYGPNANAVGHSGWGGSCVMADPERTLSAAYVMNKQSVHLIGDPRPVKLIDTLYSCL